MHRTLLLVASELLADKLSLAYTLLLHIFIFCRTFALQKGKENDFNKRSTFFIDRDTNITFERKILIGKLP